MSKNINNFTFLIAPLFCGSEPSEVACFVKPDDEIHTTAPFLQSKKVKIEEFHYEQPCVQSFAAHAGVDRFHALCIVALVSENTLS